MLPAVYTESMLKQSKQRNNVLYTYPLLNLLLSSAALLVAFTLVRMYFTVNDWMDARYFSDGSLLLKDIGMAMAMVGITSGVYVAAQVWLAVRYTKDKSKTLRYAAVALLVALSIAFVVAGVQSSIEEITSQAYTVFQ